MTTQPLSSSDLTALAERTREATPGEWKLGRSFDGPAVCVDVHPSYGSGFVIAHINRLPRLGDVAGNVEANAALIAAAPALLATALTQQEENERLREAVQIAYAAMSKAIKFGKATIDQMLDESDADAKRRLAIFVALDMPLAHVGVVARALSPKTGASG